MFKVMITDDALFMRKAVIGFFKEATDIEFIEAENGQDAVNKYVEFKPDVVTMDITMPIKDGLEALKEIMRIDPNAKILMCSAMGQESMVMDAIKSGAKDFIVKPFKADRVVPAIRKFLAD